MKTATDWGPATFAAQGGDGQPFELVASGRVRWALEALIAAGDKGCTPIDTPGPRWSDYVFKLRGMGVAIETLHEAHSGPFSGHHARYVLRSQVMRLNEQAAAA